MTISHLAALRVTDPAAFRARLRAALAAAGSITDAARSLGVHRRTVDRSGPDAARGD